MATARPQEGSGVQHPEAQSPPVAGTPRAPGHSLSFPVWAGAILCGSKREGGGQGDRGRAYAPQPPAGWTPSHPLPHGVSSLLCKMGVVIAGEGGCLSHRAVGVSARTSRPAAAPSLPGQPGIPLLGRAPPPPCPLRMLVTAHGPFTGTCPAAGAQRACDRALGSPRGCGRWA